MSLSSVTGASSILQPGVCTSTTRPASPYDGQVIYETDTDKVAVYDSSSWVYKTSTSHVNPALVCVKAETDFSAVTSVTLDNIFTSTYTNYKIIVRYTTTTNNAASLQLRASGSTASGSNYNLAAAFTDGATPGSFTQNSQTSWVNVLVSSSTFNNSATLDLFAPQLATPTLAIVEGNVNLGAYTTNRRYSFALNHTLATAYDGFIFSVATGTWTGTYAVYGYGKSV